MAIINQLPSPFVVEWVPRVARIVGAPARALDLASGRGRHTHLLARAGFETYGVDRNAGALVEALAAGKAQRLTLKLWCADLTVSALPPERFDLVLVTRYLDRNLFPSIAGAIRAGGVVIYETFTVRQRELGVGPTSPAHLLERDELRWRFEGFETLCYEEVRAPEAVARIVARKPGAGVRLQAPRPARATSRSY